VFSGLGFRVVLGFQFCRSSCALEKVWSPNSCNKEEAIEHDHEHFGSHPNPPEEEIFPRRKI